MAEIKFGTDGWRGRIAEDYTFDSVRLCAQGIANHLKKSGLAGRGMVVGYDTRFASEYFAEAVAEVLAGNDIKTYLTEGATPTPVLAYAVLENKTAGNVVITASHNPAWYNGLKVRSHYGGAAAPEALQEIEAEIAKIKAPKRLSIDEAKRRGLIEPLDPAPAYVSHLRSLIDLEPLRQAGLRIVADSMWGAGAGWFASLLGGGSTEIEEIHGQRNPIFPEMEGPEPIPPNIDVLRRRVVEGNSDVGLATDGDSDRLGVVDERGNFVNQLQVYALLALYLLEVRGWRGPMVKTLSSTSMLYRLGEIYNVPVYETGVGFKYVAPKMLEVDAIVGGEESGGFAFRGHVPERDGILAGLFILDFMVHCAKRPSELVEYLYSKVGPHYYDRIDRVFPPQDRERVTERLTGVKPERLGGLKVVDIDAEDGFRFKLEGGAWLLVRFSGTEPKIRVYAEAQSEETVRALLEEGVRLAGIEGSS